MNRESRAVGRLGNEVRVERQHGTECAATSPSMVLHFKSTKTTACRESLGVQHCVVNEANSHLDLRWQPNGDANLRRHRIVAVSIAQRPTIAR